MARACISIISKSTPPCASCAYCRSLHKCTRPRHTPQRARQARKYRDCPLVVTAVPSARGRGTQTTFYLLHFAVSGCLYPPSLAWFCNSARMHEGGLQIRSGVVCSSILGIAGHLDLQEVTLAEWAKPFCVGYMKLHHAETMDSKSTPDTKVFLIGTTSASSLWPSVAQVSHYDSRGRGG